MFNSYKNLLIGYKHFRDNLSYTAQDNYNNLAVKGQFPKTLLIACCDSRLEPFQLTNSSVGDLFVIRNVANLVPNFDENSNKHAGVIAGIQYAVNFLMVENIIVLGHSCCGGIASLLDKDSQCTKNENDFIYDWMQLAQPAILEFEKQKSTSPEILEKLSIINSMQNCLSYPWIKEKVDLGKLHIYGWHFDIQSAQISCYDNASQKFSLLQINKVFGD